MRILYINKNFSSPMGILAKYITQNTAHVSVFLADRWPRDTSVPGIMLMRLAQAPEDNAQDRDGMESQAMRHSSNAQRVRDACVRLRKSGFVPHVIYATALDGYAQSVADVFPQSRMVVRLEWSMPEAGPSRPSTVQAHMCNALQMSLLSQCAGGVCSSDWQKAMFGAGYGESIHVVRDGVDTHFFKPPAAASLQENILFACQGSNPARGIREICQSLPELLILRPLCRVFLVSFAGRRSAAGRAQHVKELEAMLPPLLENQRQRVQIMAAPPPNQYLALLQQASVYVYLTSPTMLSAGLLEAMSCGALVLASGTEAVREIVQAGHNGLLWKKEDPQGLAFQVAQTCQSAAKLHDLGIMARKHVESAHDLRILLPQHAAVLLGTG